MFYFDYLTCYKHFSSKGYNNLENWTDTFKFGFMGNSESEITLDILKSGQGYEKKQSIRMHGFGLGSLG